jgi:hypothetical protein
MESNVDEEKVTEIETLAKQLSLEELEDILMFCRMRLYAIKGNCRYPKADQWLVFPYWKKRLNYSRAMFWYMVETMKGFRISWEKESI